MVPSHSTAHSAAADRRYGALAPAALTGGLAALGYALTAQTTVGYHDAAELALRAAQLGATHGPGAPLHTLAGWVATLGVGDAAAATTWISVAAGAGAAAVLTGLLRRAGLAPGLSVATGLAFAATHMVWGNAVVTELYALSTLLVAAMLTLAWGWRATGQAQLPRIITVCYGLALAAHFANVVLLPAYGVLLLLARRRGAGLRHLLAHLGLLTLGVAGIALVNVALAARVPPFGPYVPDSVGGLLLYMSGAEHAPLQPRALADYLARCVEHAVIVTQNYAFVGVPFALAGLYRMVRADAAFALFQVLCFGGFMGYFSLFGPGDYFAMVVPAYLLVSIWLAYGADAARRRWLPGWPAEVAALLPLCLLALSLQDQAGERRSAAAAAPALSFAARAFAELPPDSLVIARWNEFTVLRYQQALSSVRTDLDLVVPARTVRHYVHGVVPDYMQLVASSICTRPVVTNRPTPELEAVHDLRPLAAGSEWQRVYLRTAELCTAGQEG
ncbi:MAG: DUF2723 domain-containing protein [Gammaproteobacteria bacterium]|jgi:hypothetical protein|nr:DUF2723 domain-containing protein [Gammaproteobacteria bacterium]